MLKNYVLFAENESGKAIRIPVEEIFSPHVKPGDLKIYVSPDTYTAEDFAEAVESEAEFQAEKYGSLKNLGELEKLVERDLCFDMIDNARYYTRASLDETFYEEALTDVLINLCNEVGLPSMNEAPYFRLEVYLTAALWLAAAFKKIRSNLSPIWGDITEEAKERINGKTFAAFTESVKKGTIPFYVTTDDYWDKFIQ